jgi:hypothetical protein
MGGFWRSIPEPIFDWVKEINFSNSVAVETGTHIGDGADLLKKHFDQVITFERDEQLANICKERFKSVSAIKVVTGSTRDFLLENLPKSDSNAFFWLDAHWSGGVTAGEDDPCPLLYELEVIFANREASNSIVLIDDVRLLVGGDSGWPTLMEVAKLSANHHFDGVCFDDVLVLATQERIKNLERFSSANRANQIAPYSNNWETAFLNLSSSSSDIINLVAKTKPKLVDILKNFLRN